MNKKKVFLGIALFLIVGTIYVTFANPLEDEKIEGINNNQEEINKGYFLNNGSAAEETSKKEVENDVVEENEEPNQQENEVTNPVTPVIVPVITIAEEETEIKYGDDYDVLEGVTVNTNDTIVASPTSEEIKELGLGTHTVTYKVIRNNTVYSKEKTLNIVDEEAPQLKINGSSTMTLKPNATYTEEGITVTDNHDENIEYKIDYIHYRDKDGNWVGEVKEVDTTKLGEYKILYTATDESGNKGIDINNKKHEYIIRTINVKDSSIPTIEIKKESVGNMTEKVFSNVSFKLYDEHLVDKVIINGKEKDLTNNKWSDLNNVKVGNMNGVAGKNTVTVVDVQGNESSIEFTLDNTKPTITVKDGYEGNLDKNVFTKLSFKLSDNNKIDKIIVNGKEKDLTDSKYSDHNSVEVGKAYGVSGKNTITLYDIAGNASTYEFFLDNEAPVINLPSTIGRNKNEMHVERTANVPVESVKALVIDNYDGETELYPYKADLLVSSIASENTYNYDYMNKGFDTTKTGRYNLYYKVKDTVGNESTITMLLVIKDTVKPVVSLAYSETNLTNNDVTATLTSSEKLDMENLQGWTEEGTTYTKVFTANNEETISIKDLYGNKSEDIVVTVENIDKVAPVLGKVEDIKIRRFDIVGNTNITASDNVDENVSVEKVIEYTKPYATESTIVTRIDTTVIGTYTITYTAKDQAGNVATKERNIIVDQLLNSKQDILFVAPLSIKAKKGEKVPTIEYEVYDLFDNQIFNKTSLKDRSYVDYSEVNMSKKGKYNAYIYATDWTGETSKWTVSIKVS